MDNLLRNQIADAVSRVMADKMELYDEKWVTGTQLCESIACFTRSWLRSYGHTLPRAQVTVTEDSGDEHRTSWCYPLHKIQRLLHEGKLKQLKV